MKSFEASVVAVVATGAAIDMQATQSACAAHDVEPGDFESPSIGSVWAVVRSMVAKGEVPDVFNIERRLPHIERAALVEMLMTQEMAPPQERLALMADVGQRRRITKALMRVVDMAKNTALELSSTVAEAQKALQSVQCREVMARTSEGDMLALIDHLEAVAKGLVLPVLPTGIHALDALIGGLQKTLTIIGAGPGVGKSALIASIVRNLGLNGTQVGLFSLEDERSWIAKRLAADACGIPLFVLQTKPLTNGQRLRLEEGSSRVYDLLRNVCIDDRPALSTADVVSAARQMIVRDNCKAVIVDHLGEIRLDRSDRHDLDISDVLQQLRALAKVYQVPVVVACHLKQAVGHGDEPKLNDFAFSAAVSRMARVAIGLSRPGGSEDIIRATVLKQTNGQSNVFADLNFSKLAGVIANGVPS